MDNTKGPTGWKENRAGNSITDINLERKAGVRSIDTKN